MGVLFIVTKNYIFYKISLQILCFKTLKSKLTNFPSFKKKIGPLSSVSNTFVIGMHYNHVNALLLCNKLYPIVKLECFVSGLCFKYAMMFVCWWTCMLVLSSVMILYQQHFFLNSTKLFFS